MKISNRRQKKLDRKKLIADYRPSPERVKQEAELFDKLVIRKNESYDILTTEDAILPADEKKPSTDSK